VTDIILAVRNLTTSLQIDQKCYPVVDRLSFNLKKGQCLALVGESGCGKSMTALSIMRILPSPPARPSTGEIFYRGCNLLALSEREMRKLRGGRIAMIFQDPGEALNPVYTIGDQLIESAQLHLGIDGDIAEAKALQALIDVGIPAPSQRLAEYPHQLSGGMKQRVMIAMALIGEPDILIADEPTTALDVTVQAQVLALMRELQRRNGMALLLITHDLGVVAEMADEVVVMYASQSIEKADVLELFDRPAHPYTQGLFRSRVALADPLQRLSPIVGTVPSIEEYPSGCRFYPRCPQAMDQCTRRAIPLYDIGNGNGHPVRCVLYKDSGAENFEGYNEQ
jgi:oligopeptide/dipeptide ABC transporter ATP-binding protein